MLLYESDPNTILLCTGLYTRLWMQPIFNTPASEGRDANLEVLITLLIKSSAERLQG